MGKSKQLSEDLRISIVRNHESGKGYKTIAKELKVPLGTVKTLIRKWKMSNSVKPKPRDGRPRKLSAKSVRRIVREVVQQPQTTASDLQESLREGGIQVSTSTIRRELNNSGLYGRVARKKPLLRPQHKNARLRFAKKHIDEPQNFWNKVIWTDETKIELFGHNQQRYVWRKENEAFKEKNTIATVKHGGGSLMLWGCVSYKGPGNLVKIEGKLNAQGFQEILQNNLQDSARNLSMGRNWILQQDNDPKHTAKSVQAWFKQKKIKVLEWPSQSPDLNIIEAVWGDLKRAVHTRRPANLAELEAFCHEEWAKIPAERIQRLIGSYSKRLSAVIDAKGGNTKY